MNLSIIIPNYNGAHLLEKNLPKVYDSVQYYRDGKAEIIIPDDPSTDNSNEVIKNFISSLKNKNICGKTVGNKLKSESGFSKNVNRGIQLATGDVIILLNTDITPNKDFLTYLLPHFKDKKVFAVGCMDKSIEKDKNILRGRGIGGIKKGLLVHSRGEIGKDNTLWASGGSSAFRKEIWDEIGGLDEIYNPFYWEDIDISYRGLKSGYKIVFEKKSILIHEHDKGAIRVGNKESNIKKIAYRNQFFFIWLNITDSDLLLEHILYLPYHMLKAIIRRDWAFLIGFFIAIAKLNQIIPKRTSHISKFVLKDSEVLSQFKI